MICQKTGWHQKAKHVLGCFPKHTIQKQTNRLTVQGQNNYTEQLQKQYITIIQVQKHNDKIITITWTITRIIMYKIMIKCLTEGTINFILSIWAGTLFHKKQKSLASLILTSYSFMVAIPQIRINFYTTFVLCLTEQRYIIQWYNKV